MNNPHLLIIRFSAMGDVAMLVPVVASLAKTYPNLRITVLSQPFARAFFEKMAPNVSFMEARLKKEDKGIKGLNAIYRRLQAKHFTAVADMHDVLRTKYLRMRFNVDRYKVAHINKHRKEKRQLCSKDNKQLRQLPTSFSNYADVLSKLGYPTDLSFTSIFDSSGAPLSELQAAIGTKAEGDRWIGIAPFAAHKGKILPVEKTEEVINTLIHNNTQCRIFLFGGGEREMKQFSEWKEKHPQCTIVGNHLKGLSQELILMSQLNVMLSMDSANMHLASLVNTPVVSIWGATHPYAGFMGWNQKESNAVQLPLACRPCSVYGGKPCHRGDYACLNDIKPETIVEKIENIIGS